LESLKFQQYIREAANNAEKQGKKPDYYIILRNSLLKVYASSIIFCFFVTLVAECSAVYLNYHIGALIKFIKYQNDGSYEQMVEGIKLVAVLAGFMVLS